MQFNMSNIRHQQHQLDISGAANTQSENDIHYLCVYMCVCLCLQSLSRLTRVVPAVFLAVIDTCGSVAILECVGGAGARVQQHLLNAMASALAASRIQTHRITQNRVCVCQKQI